MAGNAKRQAILDRVSRLRSITINADWVFRSRNAEQRSRVVLLRHDTLAALLEVAAELELPDLARDLEIAVERGGRARDPKPRGGGRGDLAAARSATEGEIEMPHCNADLQGFVDAQEHCRSVNPERMAEADKAMDEGRAVFLARPGGGGWIYTTGGNPIVVVHDPACPASVEDSLAAEVGESYGLDKAEIDDERLAKLLREAVDDNPDLLGCLSGERAKEIGLTDAEAGS